MPTFPAAKHLWHPLLALVMLLAAPATSQAIDPKFELDATALGKRYAIPPSPSAAKRQTAAEGPREKMSSYTLKRGDDLKRVLSREYGVRGARAEALLQRVAQVNNIKDIRSLKTGSTIMIPAEPLPAPKSARTRPRARHSKAVRTALRATSSGERTTPVNQTREADAVVAQAREIWNRLVPPDGTRGFEQFDYLSNSFSLSLDPERYPTLAAQDGGSILMDGRGTLPALVKTLIREENPQVRIVSDPPAYRQRFYRSLLNAARFYSFEEDFSVHFGADPQITVRADFKIEKSPDSLMRQEITLLNVSKNRRATPQGLVTLLAEHGFQLVEAGSPSYRGPGGGGGLLYRVTEEKPVKILDSFLDALAVPFETGQSIDLYARDNIGVRLEVPVDRYFAYKGRRYVAALFNGDPVNYTLIRLLETKGYRVIMLEEDDDLQTIADQLLPSLQLPGRYEEHELWPLRDAGYGVRISGVSIRGNGRGENIFVTDRPLDQLVRELAESNGYRLGGR